MAFSPIDISDITSFIDIRLADLNVDDKVLVLLPTDHNKLPMQWKGPYKVETVVAQNDYGVNVNGSIKTYHINLLKQYIPRDGDGIAATSLFDITCSASIVDDGVEGTDELPDIIPMCGKLSKGLHKSMVISLQTSQERQT